MTDINAALSAVSQELTMLLKDTNPSAVAMSFDQFLAYCGEQIALAKADKDPTSRVNALLEAVKLAKAHSWEDGGTVSVPMFNQGESADAEKMTASFSVPGPEAAPAAGAGGAFAAASGPTGPASNTASPAERHMPPTFPQSEPTGAPQGFLAKAKELIGKAAPGDALARELAALLTDQPPIGGSAPAVTDKMDDGWPADLATPEFLADKPAAPVEEDFGYDPTLA